MLEGFTGYLLPWDQTAYWATVVGININGTAPFVGPFIAQFLRGGAEIGADTLSSFYSIHMLLLPGAIVALIGLHLYLVDPARRHVAAVVEGGRGPRAARARAERRAAWPRQPAPPRRDGAMSTGQREAGASPDGRTRVKPRSRSAGGLQALQGGRRAGAGSRSSRSRCSTTR